jgi:ABC-type Fe3+/spermidine/putrescine transport system ATPase subunit
VRPDDGRVLIDGRDVTDLPTHRRELGMVFQNFALFPHMTVRDNVGFPLMIRGIAAADRAARVVEALRLVRLEGHAEKHPRQLSGGQQQRVGLARALVYRPQGAAPRRAAVNRDAKLREEMRFEIKGRRHASGITAVYVTHDGEEALALSNRIAIMNAASWSSSAPRDTRAPAVGSSRSSWGGQASSRDGWTSWREV